MKFIKLSSQYMFKNIAYLFIFSIIPAVFIGSVLNPFKIIEFANIYSSIPVTNFGTIFYGLIDFTFLQISLWIVGLVLLSIFVAGIIGQMEHHLRSGKLNIAEAREYVNNNVLLVFVNIFILFIVAIIIMFVTATILFLLHLVMSGINVSPTVGNVVVSNVMLSIIFVMYAFVASTFFINIANMMTNGYPFRHSFGSVIKLQQKNSLQLIVAILLPFTLITLLISIFVISSTIMPFVNIVGTLLLIMYFSSFAVTTYFELTKTKRYDNIRKYYYK